ncbi:hypothetical protein C8Q73DRAFT_793881 [Cubamyces lactineus]|nr:hypothetical protein C8Q73DRAFT_793881 [Cubamyces lactineus]
MSEFPHPVFNDSGAPRIELADGAVFPVGTDVIDVGDVARVFVKQASGLWQGGSVLDGENATLATNEIPPQSVAEVEVASHSDVFSAMQYLRGDKGNWTLLNAKLLDGMTRIVIIPQDAFKPEQEVLVVVNYHAISLSSILADHVTIRDPHCPAFDVDIIKNERRSIQYRFSSCPLPASQPRIRTEKTRTPKTRVQLAVMIAKDLQEKLAVAGEDALTLFDQPVAFDDLVLLSAEFIGRGTIQPRIGVIRPIDDGLVQP